MNISHHASSAEARAGNAGVVSGGTWSVVPQVVGASTMEVPAGSELRDLLWQSPIAGSLISATPIQDFGNMFRPRGVSFRQSTLAGDRA